MWVLPVSSCPQSGSLCSHALAAPNLLSQMYIRNLLADVASSDSGIVGDWKHAEQVVGGSKCGVRAEPESCRPRVEPAGHGAEITDLARCRNRHLSYLGPLAGDLHSTGLLSLDQLLLAGSISSRGRVQELHVPQRWTQRGLVLGPGGRQKVETTPHTLLCVSFPQMCTPANTPATPPNFPDALTMFSRLKASESFNSSSPVASMATSPPPPAPPLPQHGAFNPTWPAASPPGQQQSMWTPAASAQPAGWPAAVSQQATAEQKANVTMEAER